MADAIESHVDLASLPKEERLSRMRHSAAHVLAEAMVELIPGAELGIGPPIESGFYYDFRLPRPLSPDDLVTLEERMRKSVAGKHAVRHGFAHEGGGRAEVGGSAVQARPAEGPR